jgi:hypothetical protein
MAVSDKDVVAIDKFLGLRNNVRSEAFDLGDLEAAPNMDLDDAGKLRRRKGYSAAIFAGSYHSLFASAEVMVACTGTTLRRLMPDNVPNPSSAALRTGLTGGRIAYASLGARIYYSDGTYTGCVDGGAARSWGLDPPSAQPVATVSGGSLPAGAYQYAVTYARSDGQESGTGVAGRVQLTAVGGIQFSAVPVSSDPDVVTKNLYISPVNGDKMYRVQVLPAAATTASYYVEVMGRKPLETQFLQPPPAGQIIFEYHGRIYVVRGRRIHHTEVYAPELLDMRRGFTMPGSIVAAFAVSDGVWVWTGTEGVFLPGDDPTKFEYKPKVKYGAISGTVAYGNAENIDNAMEGVAALVATSQGVVACLNGGTMKNLTKDRFAYPVTQQGAGVVRDYGGMNQYLLVLEGSTTAGNTAF